MLVCADALAWIPLYVDKELGPAETAELEKHLHECESCLLQFEQLRGVVDNVRSAAPLYDVPMESANRVQRLVRESERSLRRRRTIGIAAALAVLSAPLFYLRTRNSSFEFADFAARSHIQYAAGIMPLDIGSAVPEAVSQWFGRRLAFRFKVPDYVNRPDNPKRYSLAGARLLEFRGSEVAYLAYTMNQRPISLLVASANKVTPSGGQTFRTGGIDFHFSADRGLRLITWTDRGLSYALVSDLDVTGAESCVICHGSSADRRKIETLPH